MDPTPPEKITDASTTAGLPVAPTLAEALDAARVPLRRRTADPRVVWISALAIALAVAAAGIAQLLLALIGVITNLAFHGRLSADLASPADHALGLWVIAVPVLGGLAVGVLARYGSRGIRGHGIPEAMEQVLTNDSRIAPRLTVLKPLSAAVAIGTGGPFGAEGPIIATGGALGSFVGQLLSTSADERKTLLAAGAAAGMAATFGSPVSAVLLAVELLLFELRTRSLVPVALAAATATAVRTAFAGSEAVFAMPDVAPATGAALVFYAALGAVLGVASVGVTRAVYAVEDAFERLPVHWMWWPAIGGLAVGIAGTFAPETLGVGYENISRELAGTLGLHALLALALWKLVSWAIALGSGTSGGTLAPLFTIGGAIGAAIGTCAVAAMPGIGIDPRVAALVGMAAIFAGASRAFLAAVVFAFETTLQPHGLLPLLTGCTVAYLVSALLMRYTIMTEKIARRGIAVPTEYAADFLAHCWVRDAASRPVVSLRAGDPLESVRAWIAGHGPGSSHQGFPVVDAENRLIGVVTRRDLLDPDAPPAARVGDLVKRPPAVAWEDSTLREAADLMVREGVGRLPVVRRARPTEVVGMLCRSDLLTAHAPRLQRSERYERSLELRGFRIRRV